MQENLPEAECCWKSCTLYELSTIQVNYKCVHVITVWTLSAGMMFHSRKLSNRINNINERALRIVFYRL